MARKNSLTHTPPIAVESALDTLGSNLRIARLARNLTIEEVAAKIGVGRRAVMDAEHGRPGTAAAVYAALLWTYNLLGQLLEVGDPARDAEGLMRSRVRVRSRRSKVGALDNDS